MTAQSDAGPGPGRGTPGWSPSPVPVRRAGWHRGPATSPTAGVIDAACQIGWRSFHDLDVPGWRARIDHLAVTPAGVFVVQCTSWPGTVRWHRSTVWAAGRSRGREVARMREAGEVVSALLAFDTRRVVPVTAVLSLIDGRPVPPLIVADGVVVVAVDMLSWLLTTRPPLLTHQVIDEVGGAVVRRFRPVDRVAPAPGQH